MGDPQNGLFIRETPIEMDDLGVPGYPHLWKLPYIPEWAECCAATVQSQTLLCSVLGTLVEENQR